MKSLVFRQSVKINMSNRHKKTPLPKQVIRKRLTFYGAAQLVTDVPYLVNRIWIVVIFFLKLRAGSNRGGNKTGPENK